MRINEKQLYLLNDNHFKRYKNYKLFTDYENKNKGARPYYICVKKKDVCWVIPLSSRVEKYKSYYNNEIKKYGESVKFHFTKIGGKESVLLIQNAFPISYKNIERPYLQYNKEVAIKDNKEVNSIKSKLDKMLKFVERGYTFYPHQPNVLELEKEIISDVEFDKYVEQLRKENSNIKHPLTLDEPILKLIKEYNKQFDTPRTLKQINDDYKIDKTKDIKNPLLQSIGSYFATQQQNVMANEVIEKTKNEVAVTKNIEMER